MSRDLTLNVLLPTTSFNTIGKLLHTCLCLTQQSLPLFCACSYWYRYLHLNRMGTFTYHKLHGMAQQADVFLFLHGDGWAIGS